MKQIELFILYGFGINRFINAFVNILHLRFILFQKHKEKMLSSGYFQIKQFLQWEQYILWLETKSTFGGDSNAWLHLTAIKQSGETNVTINEVFFIFRVTTRDNKIIFWKIQLWWTLSPHKFNGNCWIYGDFFFLRL